MTSDDEPGSDRYEFCPACGIEAIAGNSFCGHCGHSLTKEVDRPEQPDSSLTEHVGSDGAELPLIPAQDAGPRVRLWAVWIVLAIIVLLIGAVVGIKKYDDTKSSASPPTPLSSTTTIAVDPVTQWENLCTDEFYGGWQESQPGFRTVSVTVCGYSVTDDNEQNNVAPAGQVYVNLVVEAQTLKPGSGQVDDEDIAIAPSPAYCSHGTGGECVPLDSAFFTLAENGSLTNTNADGTGFPEFSVESIPEYFVISTLIPQGEANGSLEIVGNPGGTDGGAQWTDAALSAGKQSLAL